MNRGVINVENAIRSMTSLPAEIMSFQDRGLLREGYKADITVLDLEKVRDRASYFQPHRFSEGIPYVMVNGGLVVDSNFLTFRLPGQVIAPQRGRQLEYTDD